MGRPCISAAIKRRRLRAMDSACDVTVAGQLRPSHCEAIAAPVEQKPQSIVAEKKPRVRKAARPSKRKRA